jgi:hypothetical protein
MESRRPGASQPLRGDLAAPARAAGLAEREAICAELETLAQAPEGATPEAVGPAVLEALARWRRSGPAPREQAGALEQRFSNARDRLVEAHAESFRGTELDPYANQAKMEKLCARVEAHLAELAPFEPGASPSEILADRLRAALAANTMGARAQVDARWQAAAADVEAAQIAWKRLGPLPGEAGRALAARFEQACRRFQAERPSSRPPGQR